MNIAIPEGTKRIVLISNIKNPPAFTFASSDLIVEMNQAVHHQALLDLFNKDQANLFLVVRHNKQEHFFPKDFTKNSRTWSQVYMTSDLFGFNTEDWFEEYFYRTDGKQTPTTGFCLYKYFRARRPNMPIVGLGFNPDDHSTPHVKIHDWKWEFDEYAKDKNFTALK